MTAIQTKPIATQIFQIVLFGNLISLLLLLIFAWWSLEKLESTAIEADRRIELDYFEQYGEKTKPRRIQTSQLISVFQPKNLKNPEVLPIVFQNIPVPFQGEVESINKEYSVIAHEFPEGTFYMAKDLRLFEEQEEIYITSILSLALIILLVSFFLAFYASRKISEPIMRFTQTLHNLHQTNSTVYIDKTFHNTELNQIATAVNGLIEQIDDNVQRERKFIAMASHELRTPIAVVLGAANVLEKRNNLDNDDRKTLQRIIHASKDMSENIQTLLMLARTTNDNLVRSACDLNALLSELYDNYALENAANRSRLHIQLPPIAIIINADRALARIVIHNLIRNALQHTAGAVTVTALQDHMDIADEGGEYALPELNEKSRTPAPGLGLYIVSLACEALGWHYQLQKKATGSCIQLFFN